MGFYRWQSETSQGVVTRMTAYLPSGFMMLPDFAPRLEPPPAAMLRHRKLVAMIDDPKPGETVPDSC